MTGTAPKATPSRHGPGEAVLPATSAVIPGLALPAEPPPLRAAAGGHQPFRDTLPAPAAATPRPRRWFDPRRGWFRRLERDLSHFLSLRVYPWLPGLHRIYGAQIERSLTVSEARVRIPGLPRGFEGINILFISDVHTGPFLSRRALQRAFNRLLTLEPDMILLGGDLTTCQISELVPCLPAFRSLIAPLGTYAVLGNHDHYAGDPVRMRELLESVGIRVLHNRSVTIERGGGRLLLAGIDDLYQGQPDLRAALSEDGEDAAAAALLREALARCVVPATVERPARTEKDEAASAAAHAEGATELELAMSAVGSGVGAPMGVAAASEPGAAAGSGGRITAAEHASHGRHESQPSPQSRTGARAPAAGCGEPAGPGFAGQGQFEEPDSRSDDPLPEHAGTERAPVILLSHNPDILFEASERGVDLVLAGHTHGGQIRIPGLPVIVRQSRFRLDEGRYVVNNTELVVSRGLGVSGIPLRIACTPEAVLVQLRAR